jgi:Uma2 family endonuclease
MSIGQSFAEIEYPESDGKPMAETELHLEWMIDLRNRLKYRYRDQWVYVGCNMLLYFEEGNPRKSVAPDVFVVKECNPRIRRTFKTWEEQRVPNVVFEITSDSTRREDEQFKPQTYARIGVKELFLYDPTGDYLDPMLQGFRFGRGRRSRIRPDASGALACRQLGLQLRLDNGDLRMFDAPTGKPLPTAEEDADARADAAARRADAAARRAKAERARAQEEQARADAERARAQEEQARADAERAAREAAEAELRRLREKLDRGRTNGS